MGTFTVVCQIINAGRPSKVADVPQVLVDCGSEFTWVPETLLQRAGIITRATGYAIIRCVEFETVDEVVFGRDGDLCLLGARTLEGFGALVDAAKKRLVAAGPYPAAVGK
jgi:hypothetical protein